MGALAKCPCGGTIVSALRLLEWGKPGLQQVAWCTDCHKVHGVWDQRAPASHREGDTLDACEYTPSR
jgi:hypothetical protein